jgi:hypothetical protein
MQSRLEAQKVSPAAYQAGFGDVCPEIVEAGAIADRVGKDAGVADQWVRLLPRHALQGLRAPREKVNNGCTR